MHRRGTWPSNPFELLQAKKLTPADRTRANRALTPSEIDALVQAAPVRAVQEWKRTHPNASAAKPEEPYMVDVLVCRHCGGKRRLLAAIHAPESVRRVLVAMGLSPEVPVPGPARGPPEVAQLLE